ncbi:unnamed protein product [Effrenium voratum]|nr:unnamed protein product [Effrenium voratum]
MPHRQDWYEDLQAALLDLLTCRDTGDDPPHWWECAEGLDDCSWETRRKHTERFDPCAEAQVSDDWAQFEFKDAEVPVRAPAKQVEWPGFEAQEPEPPPRPPRQQRLSAGPKAAAPPRPQETRPERPSPRTLTAQVQSQHQTVSAPKIGPRKLGPAALAPAICAKLGDCPAPSFQVAAKEALSLSASTASTSSAGEMTLRVLLQGDRWVSLHFHRSEDLNLKAGRFLEEHRLSSLVKAGLMHQLRQMVLMRQLSASVDVVDLLSMQDGYQADGEGEPGGERRLDVFEFLDRIEDYHPSHLVAWLQSRLVTIEEVAMPGLPFQDHYCKLEVSPDADAAAVRRAYRKLALVTHPDKPTGDRQRFEEISRAHEVLTDPALREVFDRERVQRATEELSLRARKLRLRPSTEVAKELGRDLEQLGGRAREALLAAVEALRQKVAELAAKEPQGDLLAGAAQPAGPLGSNFL